jgi:protein TonB
MKTIILSPVILILLFTSIAIAQKTDTSKNTQQVQDSIAVKKSKDKKSDAPVLTIVELMPKYPGGEEAMYKYISDNLQYPQYAKEHGISGTVIITFVVERDGSITNVHAIKDIGGGCGAEAEIVIRNMPNWIPGKQDGAPVRVQFNLPIKFTLTHGGCLGIF